MGAKMLVDAAHPEETRVVVVQGNRVEDFDYESASRKQLRGNIYLAKVTRVEPSLQAAFVDYGGNRHGFLAFNEIHPDYYQIPVADRQALLDEEAQEESEAEAEAAAVDAGKNRKSRKKRGAKAALAESDQPSETISEELPREETEPTEAAAPDEKEAGNGEDAPTDELNDAPRAMGLVEDQGVHEFDDSELDDENNGANFEALGSEDALEEVPVRTRRRRRVYKIQEVIKRRQIILVQVVKEERGNKGAALTTYLSLAGRFTVLMPNTARGGGISRKISNASDRKRLRKIVGELDVTAGMGLIVRTAGASRTKAEIKRDYEYLLRMWENVRDLTLHSTAPSLVYEEGNLIKRSIRDLYNKDIDEVLVAGEDAHKEAKDFMRMLMPSHAKNVKPYREPAPIFTAFQIERQLSAMFSPEVTLKSGGYIVINQTEALVAIDVNSGKATREHNIEDTALRTNLEAVEEVTRQLRLRDLAGLLVIDFIDMEERRNNRSVERRLKDCLRGDRARIQVGRISHFGLMEMSRQRLRPGVLEGSTSPCNHCQGTGIVRSTESVALDVLRTLEDVLISDGAHNMIATTAVDVALYILNQKRANLKDIEARYGIEVAIEADDQLHGANFSIARIVASEGETSSSVVVQMDWGSQAPAFENGDGDKRSKRKRRRKRPRSEGPEAGGEAAAEARGDRDGDGKEARPEEGEAKPARSGKPRRRGRRGGRRVRAAAAKAQENAQQEASGSDSIQAGTVEPEGAPVNEAEASPAAMPEPTPAPAPKADGETPSKPAPRRKKAAAKSASAKTAKPRAKTARKSAKSDEAAPSPASGDDADTSKNGGKKASAAPKQEAPAPESKPTVSSDGPSGDDDKKSQRRGGWWQKGA
jgi:ribonuclease E